jgi:hypothetical protein
VLFAHALVRAGDAVMLEKQKERVSDTLLIRHYHMPLNGRPPTHPSWDRVEKHYRSNLW